MFTWKFRRLANRQRLQPNERRAIRERIAAYMDAHPARGEIAGRWAFRPSADGFFALRLRARVLAPSLAIFALLAATGGTVYAAEASLPGDFLYTLKVEVNERVWTALTLTAEGRARWSVRQAERRAEEAEQLLVTGRLNAETENQLARKIQQHVQTAAVQQGELKAHGRSTTVAEISARLQGSLQAHQQVITQLRLENEGATEAGANLNAAMAQSAAAVAAMRTDAQAAVNGSPNVAAAAAGRLRAAEQKIEAVERFLERKGPQAGAALSAEAAVKLEAAKETINAGKADLEAEVFGEAFGSFQNAQTAAQEAQVLVQQGSKLRLERRGRGRTKQEPKRDDDAATAATAATSTATSTAAQPAATDAAIEVEAKIKNGNARPGAGAGQSGEVQPPDKPGSKPGKNKPGGAAASATPSPTVSPSRQGSGSVNSNTNINAGLNGNVNLNTNINAGLNLGR